MIIYLFIAYAILPLKSEFAFAFEF